MKKVSNTNKGKNYITVEEAKTNYNYILLIFKDDKDVAVYVNDPLKGEKIVMYIGGMVNARDDFSYLEEASENKHFTILAFNNKIEYLKEYRRRIKAYIESKC